MIMIDNDSCASLYVRQLAVIDSVIVEKLVPSLNFNNPVLKYFWKTAAWQAAVLRQNLPPRQNACVLSQQRQRYPTVRSLVHL